MSVRRMRYGKSKFRKRQRQEEAIQRQERWAKYSIAEQLAQLDFRPGLKAKQRTKLLAIAVQLGA